MAPKPYRIIEHTADTGFEVRGGTREALFEAAARAFFDIMWESGAPRESKPETIEVHGSDPKELMVNFLEEFLYLYDAKGLICRDLQVRSVSDSEIIATAWLQRFNRELDHELLGVKAVTYHQLYIGKRNRQWTARIFLDI